MSELECHNNTKFKTLDTDLLLEKLGGEKVGGEGHRISEVFSYIFKLVLNLSCFLIMLS